MEHRDSFIQDKLMLHIFCIYNYFFLAFFLKSFINDLYLVINQMNKTNLNYFKEIIFLE